MSGSDRTGGLPLPFFGAARAAGVAQNGPFGPHLSSGGGSVMSGFGRVWMLNPSDQISPAVPTGTRAYPGGGTQAGTALPSVFLLLLGFLSAIVFLKGCGPQPAGPFVVRPGDLARSYHDDPATAARAYDGHAVRLPLAGCRRTPTGYCWSLAATNISPPVIVFDFAGPVPAGGWVEGVCRGRVEDADRREAAGYTFHVVIEGCRAIPPPPTPAP